MTEETKDKLDEYFKVLHDSLENESEENKKFLLGFFRYHRNTIEGILEEWDSQNVEESSWERLSGMLSMMYSADGFGYAFCSAFGDKKSNKYEKQGDGDNAATER